jgi:tetratricopeptide (TPR) repeat protein
LAVVALTAVAYFAIYRECKSIDHLFLSLAGIDMVVHFVVGGLIWALSRYALLRLKPGWSATARVVTAFAVTAAIVGADELSQSFSSVRTVDIVDPLSGLAGSFVAALAVSTWRARFVWATAPLLFVGWAVYDTHQTNHHFFEGILLEREAKYEEAYESYLLALEASPGNAQIYNSLAWVCLEFLQRYDIALDWALQGNALNPNDSDLLDTLGWAYYKNGQLAPALELVSRAAELDPEHPIIQEHLEVLRAAGH